MVPEVPSRSPSFQGGTVSSNPSSSSRQSVSAVNPEAIGEKPALWRRSAGGWGREKGRAGGEPGLLRRFSLTGIDAVPPPENSELFANGRAAAVGPRPGAISVRSCGLASEQFLLL